MNMFLFTVANMWSSKDKNCPFSLCLYWYMLFIWWCVFFLVVFFSSGDTLGVWRLNKSSANTRQKSKGTESGGIVAIINVRLVSLCTCRPPCVTTNDDQSSLLQDSQTAVNNSMNIRRHMTEWRRSPRSEVQRTRRLRSRLQGTQSYHSFSL